MGGGAGSRRALVIAVALATVLGAPAAAQAAEQQAYAAAMTYLTPAVVAAPGDTLRFNNLDPLARHDIVSDENRFRSALVAAGQSALVDGVEKLPPGNYAFHCSLHPWMRGAVTVAAGAPPIEPPPVEPPPSGPPDPVDLLPKVPVAERLGVSEWPSYGRDLANSRDGSHAEAPTAAQAAALGPVWSMKSEDGDFTGTPVVAGGAVVAGSSGGTVFALDARTGALRWKRDLDRTINASAAIADGRVYVPNLEPGDPRLAALDLATGALLWNAPLVDVASEPQMASADTYGSPRVWDGKVFMGTSGYFGESISEVDVQARGSVVALDADDGKLLWRTYTVPDGQDGGAVWSTPAVDADARRLYVGTGNAYHEPAGPMTDSILALDPDTGAILDHFQATAGDAWNGVEDSLENPDADFGASPNLLTAPDGRKLVGAGQKSGLYWALDRETLDPVWSAVTGPGTFMGGIVGSTAFDANGVYGADTHPGNLWSLTRAGVHRWLSHDASPLRWNAVSVANGVLYAGDTAGVVTARDAATGVVLAKLPLGAPIWGGVSIAGGHVFVVTGSGGETGYIVAYRPRSA